MGHPFFDPHQMGLMLMAEKMGNSRDLFINQHHQRHHGLFFAAIGPMSHSAEVDYALVINATLGHQLMVGAGVFTV